MCRQGELACHNLTPCMSMWGRGGDWSRNKGSREGSTTPNHRSLSPISAIVVNVSQPTASRDHRHTTSGDVTKPAYTHGTRCACVVPTPGARGSDCRQFAPHGMKDETPNAYLITPPAQHVLGTNLLTDRGQRRWKGNG